MVKIPFSVNVTFKAPIGEYKKGKLIYGETTVWVRKDISEKEEIIKEFQKKNYKQVRVEEHAINFANRCPNCNRKGIPKVEKKSKNFDYHYRSQTGSKKTHVNRHDEYWLCYNHETKPKKCRIAQWDKNHLLFKKNGRVYTELLKYMMPHYIEWQHHGTALGFPG